MSRLDAATAQLVRGRQVWPILMVDLTFDTGPFRLWTGLGELEYSGAIYHGSGSLGSVGPMAEHPDGQSAGVLLTLSGLDNESLEKALEEDYQGRPGRIYAAALNDDMTFFSAPFLLRRGIMDVMRLVEGNPASIELSLESRDVDSRRNVVRRYTLEDQLSEYPDDTGGRYISALQDAQVTWAG